MKIKDILIKIWQYLSTPKGQRNVLIVILALCIIYFRSCGKSSIDIDMYEQNIAALTDSLRVYKDKTGQLVYEKNALISSEKDLKNLNKELGEQIKNLKDHPIVVIETDGTIVHDTVNIPVSAGIPWYDKDHTVKNVSFSWKHDTLFTKNNYRKISGNYLVQVDTSWNVSSKNFMITQDEIGISFTTGLTESKNGTLEIFVKSPYPGFKPTDVNGALIDPRTSDVIKKFFPPERWSIGPYVGYGVYFDPVKMTMGSGINAGISVSYGIFQWKGKK